MEDYTKFDALIAALASLFLPGLGQLFQKKYIRAAAFAASAPVLYFYCPPAAMAAHAAAVADAALPRFLNKKIGNQKCCKPPRKR